MLASPGLDHRSLIPYGQALELERQLLRAMAQGDGQPRFAVWRTHQALIVPRGMPGRAHFETASRNAQAAGWPVYERDTGGDLTPQSPGIVNLSLVFRIDDARPSIADAYRRLTRPVIAFLQAQYGIDAATSGVPGAFCDGAYNIAVAGRKLGGTAQRWRMLNAGNGDTIHGAGELKSAAVLAHVALMCTNSLGPAVGVLNAFYQDLAIDRHVEFDRHIILAECVGARDADAANVALALDRFLQTYPI